LAPWGTRLSPGAVSNLINKIYIQLKIMKLRTAAEWLEKALDETLTYLCPPRRASADDAFQGTVRPNPAPTL
jgi:hypothetical protein